MLNFLFVVVIGVLCFVVGVVLMIDGPDFHQGSGDILELCEIELPRNEHCVLIAVPEKGATE